MVMIFLMVAYFRVRFQQMTWLALNYIIIYNHQYSSEHKSPLSAFCFSLSTLFFFQTFSSSVCLILWPSRYCYISLAEEVASSLGDLMFNIPLTLSTWSMMTCFYGSRYSCIFFTITALAKKPLCTEVLPWDMISQWWHLSALVDNCKW